MWSSCHNGWLKVPEASGCSFTIYSSQDVAISPVGLAKRKSGMDIHGTSSCTSAYGFCAILLALTATSVFSGGISWWVSYSLF
jgi:hypothetical protein